MFSSGVPAQGTHHTSLASFAEAAAHGCRICTFLLEHARENVYHFDDHITARLSYLLDDMPDIGLCLEMKIGALENGVQSVLLEYDFLTLSTAVIPRGQGIDSERSAISITESLQAAQKWMSTCLETHEQCQKHTQPPVYPTRLLELGDHKARLIISCDEILSGPYAALSYCWGTDSSFSRLTADNLQELRLGLPYSSLPIAFQEAIQFVKGLSIQYLWVDALCIIQSGMGSKADWQTECGRMQDVYSNCIVNLTLAQASHPNQTCLRGYGSNQMSPVKVSVVYTPNGCDTEESHFCTVLPLNYFTKGLYEQPVGHRAWVLQERFLATRILSIGRGELFWDCEQVPHANESVPNGFESCSDSDRELLSNAMSLSVNSFSQITTHEDLECTWYQILQEYTARDLTHPRTDKLAAIAAIATRMGSAMNDQYLAGHFWKTLPQSLNWQGDQADLRPGKERKVLYRLGKSSNKTPGGDWVITPSWSWASVHGPLDMTKAVVHTYPPFATAESYKLVRTSEKDSTERLEHRILLTIRTWCRRLTWTAFPIGTKEMSFNPQDTGGHTTLRIIDEQVGHGNQCLLAGLDMDQDYGFDIVTGLLLRETDVDGHKVFERFGSFSAFLCGAGGPEVTGMLEKYFILGQQSITLC